MQRENPNKYEKLTSQLNNFARFFQGKQLNLAIIVRPSVIHNLVSGMLLDLSFDCGLGLLSSLSLLLEERSRLPTVPPEAMPWLLRREDVELPPGLENEDQ